MKCPICEDYMKKGKTSLTFERSGDKIMVVKNVPALICNQCGEVFVNIKTTQQVEKMVESAAEHGLKMGFLEYDTAA